MFAMPISGWFGYGGSANFILFEVPSFRNSIIGQGILELTGQTWDEWEAPWDYFHKKISGAIVLWILIVIHAGAAFYHHFVQKDEVLKRMLPEKSNK
jgi:cytochrome b561